jgi:ATP-dependent Clp protease ATP-binding subunit ClpA
MITTIDNAKKDKLLGLHSYLNQRIIGQKHIIDEIVPTIINSEMGLNRSTEPRGRLFFCGPTGVGKTETSEALTEYLFGSLEYLFKFDMSEFKDLDCIKRFIGDASGDLGRLGRVLQNNQEGVLLFDEFEKAHPDIWNLFLQILDKAVITVGKGETHNLSKFYIIFTSNEGSERITENKFTPWSRIVSYVTERIKLKFRPEMIRRFGKVVVFNKLGLDEQILICQQMLTAEIARLEKLFAIKIDYAPDILNLLISQGYDGKYGARNMKSVISELLGSAISQRLLEGHLTSGKLVRSSGRDKIEMLINC